MLSERENYDEAIYVFEHSTGELEKSKDAIEKCKYHRDGFIYDKLKNILKDLSSQEQKQLIGYSRVFKIEISLRELIDTILKDKFKNTNWLEGDNTPDLKQIKISVLERKTEYEKNSYFRDNTQKKSLIDFTTFQELEKVVEVHWDKFKEKFGNKKLVLGILESVAFIRNDVAHARFLDDKQLQKIEQDFSELKKIFKKDKV